MKCQLKNSNVWLILMVVNAQKDFRSETFWAVDQSRIAMKRGCLVCEANTSWKLTIAWCWLKNKKSKSQLTNSHMNRKKNQSAEDNLLTYFFVGRWWWLEQKRRRRLLSVTLGEKARSAALCIDPSVATAAGRRGLFMNWSDAWRTQTAMKLTPVQKKLYAFYIDLNQCKLWLKIV